PGGEDPRGKFSELRDPPIISRASGRRGGRNRADDHPPFAHLDPDPRPRGKEPSSAERRQRSSGRSGEQVALGLQNADEEELAPLELGKRAAVLEESHVREGQLLLGHAQSRPAILRATCSRSLTSLGVRSAREKSSTHSRKQLSGFCSGIAPRATRP